MKSLPATFAVCALLLAQPLFAQESLERALPERSATPDVPLIPEEVPTNAKPRGSAIDQGAAAFKKSKTDLNIEEQRERIRFREAKTKALRDTQVQAEWESSEKAKTDFEKREALKRYYKRLFTRMAKLDSSLKVLIQQREHLSLRRLEQTRIDPTQPYIDGE